MATLNAHIIECHFRAKYNIDPRSLLDFAVDLTEGLVDIDPLGKRGEASAY